ncbi:phage tail protein [Escherichia coli]|nr:phage tail protein [Escherichia coli]
MFAVLGDIEFELITYWDGFEATFGVDYAEHARIGGSRPAVRRRQAGRNPDNSGFPSALLCTRCGAGELRTAMKAHQALALVFGNGDYRGWFVITDVTATSEQTTVPATCWLSVPPCLSGNTPVTGKNPLQPPAIRTKLPGVGAVSGAIRFTFRGGAVHPQRRQPMRN